MGNFLLACGAWIGMAIVLGVGVYYAALGAPIFLILATLAFVVAIYKIGCTAH